MAVSHHQQIQRRIISMQVLLTVYPGWRAALLATPAAGDNAKCLAQKDQSSMAHWCR